MQANIDHNVVEGFGDEWSRFDQSSLSEQELERMFENYFYIFPWDKLKDDAVGFDLGCGSGRWARLVAPRVGKLYLIDPSEAALNVARTNLSESDNAEFRIGDAGSIPLDDESCDFGYSLGVLHHVPDTLAGLKACVAKLKPGAPFLLYLYYNFDNRPAWFRAVWRVTDVFRRAISRMPHALRYAVSQPIALLVYYPLARTALLLEKLGMNVETIPLSQYRTNSFYVMRTDALDRFGTRLEKRFSRAQITAMMDESGLSDISFGTRIFWTAVGYKR